MVEDNRLGSDGVNAKTALTAISKYAYDKKTLTGEDYALMMVMTEYVSNNEGYRVVTIGAC